MTTRGLRNNNPGNIRKSSDDWRGLSATQGDAEYFTFTAPVWGIRALAKVLLTYYNRHGINTVRGIVSRWSPPNENPTEALIRNMSRRLEVDADEAISVPDRLSELVDALIIQENGFNPYTTEIINEAIRLI